MPWARIVPEKGRRPPRHRERDEQGALFAWSNYIPALRWMHHIPNGGHRDRRTAAILKGQGVKPGIPDVFLPEARGGWFGFYIEMKAPGEAGNTTANQNDAMLALHMAGYCCIVADGFIAAKRAIQWYLSLSPTLPHTPTRARPPWWREGEDDETKNDRL